VVQPVQSQDYSELYKHYSIEFGSTIIPMETICEWHNAAARAPIAWKVVKHNSFAKLELAGYFDIEPLNSQGREKMIRPAATAAVLTSEDIYSGKSEGRPSAYYIGSIGAVRESANTLDIRRSETTRRPAAKLIELCGDQGTEILARPDIDDGEKLFIETFKMTKLHRGDNRKVRWATHFDRRLFVVGNSR
jgi:hypothetical protein